MRWNVVLLALLVSACDDEVCKEQALSVPAGTSVARKLSCRHKDQKLLVIEPPAAGAPRTLVCQCPPPNYALKVPPKAK